MASTIEKQADNILYGNLSSELPARTSDGDDKRLAEALMPITCHILLSIGDQFSEGCEASTDDDDLGSYVDLEQICEWMIGRGLLGPGPPPDASLLLFCLRQRTMELVERHPDQDAWKLTDKGQRWLGLVRKYRPEQAEVDHRWVAAFSGSATNPKQVRS